MKYYLMTLVAILSCVTSLLASAASVPASIVGTWKTFDDHTGAPRGLVRIIDDHGTISGTAIGTAVPGEREDAICSKCTGDFKNRPMKGLPIIQGVKATSTGLRGGTILDPDSGGIYKVKFTLSADGKKLTVRGYIGSPLFGRSQQWQRLEP